VGVESGCFSSPLQLAVGRYPVHLAEGEGPGEELAVAGEAPEMAEGHVIGFTAGKRLERGEVIENYNQMKTEVDT
jgi:hypothetical protein